MTQPPWPPPALPTFISHWQPAGGAERANYQLFLTELCDLLNVPHPNHSVPDESKNTYVFDRAITATNSDGTTTPNFIDLYHRAHFVLETKQGVDAQDTRGTCILPVSHDHGTPSVSEGPSTSRPEGSSPAQAATNTPPRKPRKLKRGNGIRGPKFGDNALIARTFEDIPNFLAGVLTRR